MSVTGVRKRPNPDEIRDREHARARLLAQEQRVQAIDRAVEVVQRSLNEGS